MDDPQVVSRDEWLAARRQLLAKEKEFTRQRDALNAERRRLPMVEVDKEYVFEGSDGTASLPDLFQDRGQLLIYHFMFDPDWDEGCPSCSFLADNIGHLAHLHARDTTLALVSRAPLAKIEPFRRRMGWTVPWYSPPPPKRGGPGSGKRGGGRRGTGPEPGRLALGASGLAALGLVAATSAHAWPSGPAVPTALAAASARVAWTCAAVRVSVHSGP